MMEILQDDWKCELNTYVHILGVWMRPHLPDAGEGRPEVAVRACAASDPLRKFLQRASAGIAPVTQHNTGVITPVTNCPAWEGRQEVMKLRKQDAAYFLYTY